MKRLLTVIAGLVVLGALGFFARPARPPDPRPPDPPPPDTANDKLLAILCHVSLFLGVGFVLEQQNAFHGQVRRIDLQDIARIDN